MASDFDFDNLAVNKVATEQWVKLASSIYSTPQVEKTAKVGGFWSALTGKTLSKANIAAGEAGRIAGETTAATEKARKALTSAETAGSKTTEAVSKATRERDLAKADIEGLGWGQKAVAKVKQLGGKGEYAKLRKGETAISKAKIKDQPTSATTKARKSELTAAEKAQAAAAKTKAEADKAILTAKGEQSSARIGGGILAGTGILGLSAASGGGGRRGRGPVIVT